MMKEKQHKLEMEQNRLVAEAREQHEKFLLTEAAKNRLSMELQKSNMLVTETQSKILSLSKMEADRQLVMGQDTNKLREELRDRSSMLLERSEDLAELKIAFEDCARQEAVCREALQSAVAKEHRTVTTASKLSKIVSKQKERLVRTIRAESREAKVAAKLATETLSLQSELVMSREFQSQRDNLREQVSELQVRLNASSSHNAEIETLQSELWDYKTRARKVENEIETQNKVVSSLRDKEIELTSDLERAREELETARRTLSLAETAKRRAEDATSAQIEICEELEAIVETMRGGDDKRRRAEEEKGDLVRRLARAREEIERKDEALTFASDEVERMQRMWHSKEEEMKRVAEEETQRILRIEAESMERNTKRFQSEMQKCEQYESEILKFEQERQRWQNEVKDKERAVRVIKEEHEARMNRIRNFALGEL